jgi:hypothetical protein
MGELFSFKSLSLEAGRAVDTRHARREVWGERAGGVPEKSVCGSVRQLHSPAGSVQREKQR